MILYEYLPSNILCMLVCVSMKAEDVEAPNSACIASQPIPNQKIDGHEWIMIRLSLLDVLVASFGEDSFVFKERVKWPVLIPAEVYCTKCYSGNECAWTCWHMFEMNVSLVSFETQWSGNPKRKCSSQSSQITHNIWKQRCSFLTSSLLKFYSFSNRKYQFAVPTSTYTISSISRHLSIYIAVQFSRPTISFQKDMFQKYYLLSGGAVPVVPVSEQGSARNS